MVDETCVTDFSAFATLDVVEVVAVLTQVAGVGVVEGQSVAADFELGHVIFAVPVLVARRVVGEETRLQRALELFLRHHWTPTKH